MNSAERTKLQLIEFAVLDPAAFPLQLSTLMPKAKIGRPLLEGKADAEAAMRSG